MGYIPSVMRIERIFQEAPEIKSFSLKYPLDFIPGQFLEVSCFGKGEAPISISSAPGEKFLRLTFRRMGSVTGGLFNFKPKDYLGIRGPFGRGFPLKDLAGKNLIFIAGGIGIAPLSSALKFILSKRLVKPQRIALLYGARTPADLLFKKELATWRKLTKVMLTVDKSDGRWKGRVGVVLQLLDEIRFDLTSTQAFVCGPQIMMRFTTARLIELGMNPAEIILSLERYMKCGIGKCGHCYIADKFVCRDGPVFTYAELNRLIPTEIF